MARLQVASERMTDRLAAGRRVDEVKLVRLINTIRRAERELGINKPKPRPVLLPWQAIAARKAAG